MSVLLKANEGINMTTKKVTTQLFFYEFFMNASFTLKLSALT